MLWPAVNIVTGHGCVSSVLGTPLDCKHTIYASSLSGGVNVFTQTRPRSLADLPWRARLSQAETSRVLTDLEGMALCNSAQIGRVGHGRIAAITKTRREHMARL